MALRALIAGAALAAIPTAAAQADLISTGACDGATLSAPFAQWGDSSSYKLIPGGNFENGGAGWTFTGKAHTAAGSDPFGITGSVGSSSLSLPAGSSAQSPFTCVNAAYPTFRLMARQSGLLSSTLIQVVYTVPGIGQVAIPVGASALSNSWRPSLPMLTASAVPGVLSGGTAQVALRFTQLLGSAQIDDVFVDPRMKR
ncbi:MAG TPA: hypothetical protein VGI87_15560 [Solirubrobacteraceae bacterium]